MGQSRAQNRSNKKKKGEAATRLISGFSLGGIFCIAFNLNYFYFSYGFLLYVFLLVAIMLTLYEFFQLDQNESGQKPNIKISLFFVFLIHTFVYLKLLRIYHDQGYPLYSFLLNILNWLGDPIHWVILLLFLAFYSNCFLHIFQGKAKGTLHLNAIIMLGMIYIVLGASHLLLVAGLENGIFYIWFISLGTIGADTMAYFSGRYFGKNKINLSVSPNKTYEGYIGSFFGQLILMYIFYYSLKEFSDIPKMSFFKITFLSIMLFMMTTLGDLTGSLLKRDAEVKDSGKFMPGHGGLLDTFDALILTIPAFYYFHWLTLNVS